MEDDDDEAESLDMDNLATGPGSYRLAIPAYNISV